MHIDIKPIAGGWAFYLMYGAIQVAVGGPWPAHHVAVAMAQTLMIEGVKDIHDPRAEQKTGGGANQT